MPTYRTAKVLLVNSAGQILLLRRSATHPKEPHHYDLPGGIVEEGEDLATALVREVAEETGLKVQPEDLKLVFTKTEEYDSRIAFRSVYCAKLDAEESEIKLSYEHDEFGWFTPQDAVEKMTKGRYIRDGLNFALQHNLIVSG